MNYDCNCIHFYLEENQTLRNFRYESWVPSLEYEFRLSCSNHGDTFTYMLGIKDDNLYPPEFSNSSYQAELQYTRLNGYQIKSTPITSGIYVVDHDFNKKHTNFTVTCEGDACSYFEFTPNYIEFNQGHHYKINVQLKAEVKNLKEFNAIISKEERLSLQISLDDGLHTKPMAKSVGFDLKIELVDSPPNDEPTTPPYLVYIIAGSVLLIMFVTCAGAVTFYDRRSRRAKDLLRQLTEAEIREFLEGNASLGTVERRSVDVNTPIMALPYNLAFEIQRDKLRIGMQILKFLYLCKLHAWKTTYGYELIKWFRRNNDFGNWGIWNRLESKYAFIS